MSPQGANSLFAGRSDPVVGCQKRSRLQVLACNKPFAADVELQALFHLIGGVHVLDRLPSIRTDGSAQRWICNELVENFARFVISRKEEAVLSVYDPVGVAAVAMAYDWQSARHRFEHHAAKSFDVYTRSVVENVETLQEFLGRLRPFWKNLDVAVAELVGKARCPLQTNPDIPLRQIQKYRE